MTPRTVAAITRASVANFASELDQCKISGGHGSSLNLVLRHLILTIFVLLIPTGSVSAAALHDESLDLSKYKGKVVYLDFWASWCGPCKISFPYMERMTAVYRSEPFVVIAVNVDHSREKADAFLEQIGADIPVVYDPRGTIAAKFKITEMPTSILIGRDGRVRYVHQGFFQDKTSLYADHISELLNEK
jgi:thiol-disulfide isomerase/thioredoxin